MFAYLTIFGNITFLGIIEASLLIVLKKRSNNIFKDNDSYHNRIYYFQ